jgi:hypothetical protein
MMTNMATTLTVRKLQAWARVNRSFAMAALKARAIAEVERARVDAYIAPIFASYGFTCAHTALTDPRKLYLSDDDELCAAYFAACDVAHREHGYQGEAGTCPALVAEDLQRQSENMLLDSLAKFIGVDAVYSLELRRKALDIAIGACVLKEAA